MNRPSEERINSQRNNFSSVPLQSQSNQLIEPSPSFRLNQSQMGFQHNNQIQNGNKVLFQNNNEIQNVNQPLMRR